MTDTSSHKPILQVQAVSKRFAGNQVFHDISLTLVASDVLGVIGPNGAGKTTLINVVSGQIAPSAGRIVFDAQDVTSQPLHQRSARGLSRTFQQTKTFKTASVFENLRRAKLFNGKGISLDAPYFTELLRMAGLLTRLDQLSDTLPYGMQKMLGLLAALVTHPRVLLLDEPAAGLETDERFFIDHYVKAAVAEMGCAILLVEHDIELVKRLCPKICVLDGGSLIAEGPPGEVLVRKTVIDAYLGTGDEEVGDHA